MSKDMSEFYHGFCEEAAEWLATSGGQDYRGAL
jgi:hypothetical protein